MCGEKFEIARDWKKIGLNALKVFGGVLVISWLILPAPFNPSYLFRRTFYNPSAICEDGIYSFSASRSGTCSNHGGVQKWLK